MLQNFARRVGEGRSPSERCQNKAIDKTCANNVPTNAPLKEEMIGVLRGDSMHKYLGRKFGAYLKERGCIGVQHRMQLAWAKFNQFRHVFVNRHLAFILNLKRFDTVVTSTVLFGFMTVLLSKADLYPVDATQNTML